MHIIALIANVIGLSIAIVWAASTHEYEAYLAVVTLAGALPLALKSSVQHYVSSAIRAINFPVEVALLGPPAAGKTVYVSALLHALMHEHKRLIFIPRARDTLERLMQSFRTLGSGNFLPRTTAYENTSYVGTIIRRRIFSRTTAVDISFHDHAGEAMLGVRRDNSKKDLQNNEVIAAAVKAQFLFIFIDLTRSDIFDYVELLHVLAELLPRTNDHRINKAIAVIIQKSDLVPNEVQRAAWEVRVKPVIAACEQLVRVHKVFFVSSTGPLVVDHVPNPRRPENLLDPLVWCLSQKLV